MESLTREEILYIARLANMVLDDNEVENFRHQLTDILAHVQSLQSVDTTGVEPTGHATDSTSVMREDVAGTPLERDQVLGNAPAASGEFIRVRAVLD